MYWLICIIIIISLLFYLYLTKNFNYWTKQGLNGPKPIFLFGTLLDKLKQSWALNDVQYLEEFGSVYGVFNGNAPVLRITDPELIKQVLVKDFHLFNNRRELRTYHKIINKMLFFSRGEDWKRIRIIASTTFTSGKMKKLYGVLRECIKEYLEHLEGVAQRGDNFDARKMHANFTIDVIACCAFATKTNAIKEPNNEFIVNLRKFFDFKLIRLITGCAFPKSLNYILNNTFVSDPQATEWLVNLAENIVDTRRKSSGEKYFDFVQLLLDAKADETFSENDNDKSHGLETDSMNDENRGNLQNSKFINKTLTKDEIMAQCFSVLTAGFETTATTLAYLSHSLAVNGECQEILYQELVGAMGAYDEISYDDLHFLPYLDACISETLRLYPPLIRLEREVNQDLILGKKRISLSKGQLIEIPIYALQHQEEYYKNPEQFIPERFLRENRNKITPYTYLPFGTGQRNCIGMRFALMQIKLVMAHILIRYRFTKCEQTVEKIQFLERTPILIPKSLIVGIEKR